MQDSSVLEILQLDGATKNKYGFSSSLGDNSQMSLSQENGILALGFSTGMLLLWDFKAVVKDVFENGKSIGKAEKYLLFAEYCHKKKIHLIEFVSEDLFMLGSLDGSASIWSVRHESVDLMRKGRQKLKIEAEEDGNYSYPIYMEKLVTEDNTRTKAFTNALNYAKSGRYLFVMISSAEKSRQGADEVRSTAIHVIDTSTFTLARILNKESGFPFSDETYMLEIHPRDDSIILTFIGNDVVLIDWMAAKVIFRFRVDNIYFNGVNFSLFVSEGKFSEKGDYFAITTWLGSMSIFSIYSKESYAVTCLQQFFDYENSEDLRGNHPKLCDMFRVPHETQPPLTKHYKSILEQTSRFEGKSELITVENVEKRTKFATIEREKLVRGVFEYENMIRNAPREERREQPQVVEEEAEEVMNLAGDVEEEPEEEEEESYVSEQPESKSESEILEDSGAERVNRARQRVILDSDNEQNSFDSISEDIHVVLDTSTQKKIKGPCFICKREEGRFAGLFQADIFLGEEGINQQVAICVECVNPSIKQAVKDEEALSYEETLRKVANSKQFCFRCSKEYATLRCARCKQNFHSLCAELYCCKYEDTLCCFNCFRIAFRETTDSATIRDVTARFPRDVFTCPMTPDERVLYGFPQVGERFYFILPAYEVYFRRKLENFVFETSPYFWKDLCLDTATLCEVIDIEFRIPTAKSITFALMQGKSHLNEKIGIFAKVTLRNLTTLSNFEVCYGSIYEKRFLVPQFIYEQAQKMYVLPKKCTIFEAEGNISVENIVEADQTDRYEGEFEALKGRCDSGSKETIRFSKWDLIPLQETAPVTELLNKDVLSFFNTHQIQENRFLNKRASSTPLNSLKIDCHSSSTHL